MLEAGEFRVLGEPGIPAGLKWLGLALAGEHLPEVRAGDAEVCGGDADAGEAGFEGLVRGTVDVADGHDVFGMKRNAEDAEGGEEDAEMS